MRAEHSLSNLSESIFGREGVRRLATCLRSFNYIKSLISNISEVSSFTSLLFDGRFLWILSSLFDKSSPAWPKLRCLDEMRLAIRVMDGNLSELN